MFFVLVCTVDPPVYTFYILFVLVCTVDPPVCTFYMLFVYTVDLPVCTCSMKTNPDGIEMKRIPMASSIPGACVGGSCENSRGHGVAVDMNVQKSDIVQSTDTHQKQPRAETTPLGRDIR